MNAVDVEHDGKNTMANKSSCGAKPLATFSFPIIVFPCDSINYFDFLTQNSFQKIVKKIEH